jgi:hypothetical protein
MRTRLLACSCLPSDPDRVLHIVSGDGCIYFLFAKPDSYGTIAIYCQLAIGSEEFNRLTESISEVATKEWYSYFRAIASKDENIDLIIEIVKGNFEFVAKLWHPIAKPEEIASVTLDHAAMIKMHEILPKIIADSQDSGD